MLAVIGTWPADRRTFRPAQDAWCVVEVLDHIVKSEVGIAAVARRGLEAPHRIGWRDRLGFLFLDRVFRSPRQVKVPRSAPQVLPDAQVNLEEVRRRWDAARLDLTELLRQVTPDQLRGGVFRHPVSGWMTLPQVLQFFSTHMIHHEFQIERIERAAANIRTG